MISVVELRQYTLRPGQRDVLIELFDREFVESQDVLGAQILGQFRDLDNPDRFVWVRGFADMAVRQESLTAFYGGPVWRAHRDAANATMIDVDNVLLLRPCGEFTVDISRRDTPVTTRVLATISPKPVVVGGGTLLGEFETDPSPNNFPALPIRTGEHVFVSLVSFPGESELAEWISPGEHLRLAPTSRSALR
jgi:hypothetical protein